MSRKYKREYKDTRNLSKYQQAVINIENNRGFECPDCSRFVMSGLDYCPGCGEMPMRGQEYSDHKSDGIFVFGRLILVSIAILLTPLFFMELDSGTLFKGKFWTVFFIVYSLVLIYYSAKSMFKTIKNLIALFRGQNRDKIKPIKFIFRLWIFYSAVWLLRVSLAKLITFVL